MRLIAGLLAEFLRETGRIQAILIRHISRAKVSHLNKALGYYTNHRKRGGVDLKNSLFLGKKSVI